MPSVSGTRWLVRSVIRDGRSGKKTRKSAAEENPRNRGGIAVNGVRSDVISLSDRRLRLRHQAFPENPKFSSDRWNFNQRICRSSMPIPSVFIQKYISSNEDLFFYSFMASRGSTRIFWKISLEKERDAELIEINFYKGILFQKNHLPWREYSRSKKLGDK